MGTTTSWGRSRRWATRRELCIDVGPHFARVETRFAPRRYVPRRDVAEGVLEDDPLRTLCPCEDRAAGALLLRRLGMPTRRIVVKSSGLFFLTSGTNVFALVGRRCCWRSDLAPVPAALSRRGPRIVALLGAGVVVAIPPHAVAPSQAHPRALCYAVDGITAIAYFLVIVTGQTR